MAENKTLKKMREMTRYAFSDRCPEQFQDCLVAFLAAGKRTEERWECLISDGSAWLSENTATRQKQFSNLLGCLAVSSVSIAARRYKPRVFLGGIIESDGETYRTTVLGTVFFDAMFVELTSNELIVSSPGSSTLLSGEAKNAREALLETAFEIAKRTRWKRGR